MLLISANDLYADYGLTVSDDGIVSVVDVSSQSTVREFSTGAGELRETFLIESQTLVVVSKKDQATIRDIDSGEIVRTIPRRIYAFTPDGEKYITYEPGDEGGLYIEDSKRAEVLAKLYAGDYGGPVSLSFSTDNRYLAVHFNSEYPLTDEQYPHPYLDHSVDWVEMFDLSTNQLIQEFREEHSIFLGEFEGVAYYLRNQEVRVGGELWDEGLRFLPDERRWESVKSAGRGLRRPESPNQLLEYDVYATILGANKKLGTVSIITYDPYETPDDAGCYINGIFSPAGGVPKACANWWQILDTTHPSVNCGGGAGFLTTPYIDQAHSATNPHPRYNQPHDDQHIFFDRPTRPKAIGTDIDWLAETYLGIEEGDGSSGTFYVPGGTEGFRWGFEWDQATSTVSRKTLTQTVQYNATQMNQALTNSCFTTPAWSISIQQPVDPCYDILEPLTVAPAIVGPYTDPRQMGAKVRIGPDYTSGLLSGLTASNFIVIVDTLSAAIATATEQSDHYLLRVQPPDSSDGIPSNGRYNLKIIVLPGDASAYQDQEAQAVEYTNVRSSSIGLVIDRSGSMDSYGYMEPAKSAASQFVELMELEDQVGVVSFSSSASVDFPLTVITSPAVKASAQAAIGNITSGGYTSIGSGMQTAQGQLNSLAEDDHAWAQVLLSDGQENEPPWIDDVLPTIPQRTDIYTIALGSSADEAKLQHVATSTGGAYFLAPSTSELLNIYNLIRGSIGGTQIIASSGGSVAQGETSNQSASIDNTVENSTFFLSWAGSDLDLTLRTPSGATIDSAAAAADPNIEYKSEPTYEYYIIQSPEAGQWNASIYGDDTDYPGESYSLSVSGDSDLRIDGSFYEESPEVYQPINLLVTMTNAGAAVTGATVTAEITPPTYSTDNILDEDSPYFGTTHPMSPMDEIALYDDGEHGDGVANDGIYGTIYTSTSVPGSYIFDIQATGTTPAGQTYTRKTLASTFLSSEPANNARIGGTISSNASDSSVVHVRAWLNDAGMTGQPDFMDEVTDTFPAEWSINNVPPGNYNVDAFMDLDGDGGYSSEEPYAAFDSTFNVEDYGSYLEANLTLAVQDFANFDEVRAYPNPYRPEHKDNGVAGMTFDNIPSDASIKIYTLAGELVRETERGDISNSRWVWDLKNDDDEDVARGVYLYYMSSSGGGDTKTEKVAVIR